MKRKIFKNWNWVRTTWLLAGIGLAITSILQHINVLLLVAIYFIFGSIANIGGFAQSCGVNFKSSKDAKTIESAYEDGQYNK